MPLQEDPDCGAGHVPTCGMTSRSADEDPSRTVVITEPDERYSADEHGLPTNAKDCVKNSMVEDDRYEEKSRKSKLPGNAGVDRSDRFIRIFRYGIGGAGLAHCYDCGRHPITTGAPDNGYEGLRSTGYTIYDGLVSWDLRAGDQLADIRPGLATDWRQDEDDPTRWIFDLRGSKLPRRKHLRRRCGHLESRPLL
jgi:hypothetical protein